MVVAMVPVPIRSQMKPIHTLLLCFLKISLNIILASTPRSYKWSLPFKSLITIFSPGTFIYIHTQQAIGVAVSVCWFCLFLIIFDSCSSKSGIHRRTVTEVFCNEKSYLYILNRIMSLHTWIISYFEFSCVEKYQYKRAGNTEVTFTRES
jgi:hypothetical protein